MVPGAEVMTQRGIYGTLVSIDDEKQRGASSRPRPAPSCASTARRIARVVEPDEVADRRRSSSRARAGSSTSPSRRASTDDEADDAPAQEADRVAATLRCRPSQAEALHRARLPGIRRKQTAAWRRVDPGPQGLAIPRLAGCVIIVVLLGIRRAGALFAGWSWTPEARARPRGRHADHPRSRRPPRARSVTPEQLDQAVVDHPPARRRLRRLRGRDHHPGRRQHRRPDPGHARPGDAAAHRRRRRSSSSAPVLLAGTPVDRHVGAATTRRRPTRRPRRRPRRRLRRDADAPTPTDGSDLDVGHARAAGRVRRLQLRRRRRRPRRTSHPPTSRSITCDDDGTMKYILGPVEVDGADITDAFSGQQPGSSGVNTGSWAVNLSFNADGGADIQALSTSASSRCPTRRGTSSPSCSTARVITAPVDAGRSPTAARRSPAASRRRPRRRSPTS